MKQKVKASNTTDVNGNPTGGTVEGVGITINWQNGPLGRGAQRAEPNGAFVEGVIEAARQRLQFYQAANGAKFWCPENERAIQCLTEAMDALESRTREREARLVEGTHTA